MSRDWSNTAEKRKRDEKGRLEDLQGTIERKTRHTRYAGLNDSEVEMLNRLKDEFQTSASGILRIALHGLYYAHFQERRK